MNETVRVLRVLEYVGEREWVENTLRQGLGPNKVFVTAKGEIRMAVVGDWPQPTTEQYSVGVGELIENVEEAITKLPEGDEVRRMLVEGLEGLAYKGNVADRQREYNSRIGKSNR